VSIRATRSVWPVAQQTARAQRSGRYLPASTAHPGKMLPELARQAICAYSEVGELVLDPMCGIGTTLVEAVHLGREAIGVELEPHWVALAATNLAFAREQGATGRGLVTHGDARLLGRGLLDQLAGRVDLIVSSPPYGDSLHGQVRTQPQRLEQYDNRYSHNRDNLAQLPRRRGSRGRPSFTAALAEILVGCRRLLAPQGVVVLTARPYRRGGELVDLPGQLEQLADDAGLELYDRLVALLCRLRGAELVPRPSFFQMQQQRTRAIPRMLLIAHEDVLVLRKQRGSPGAPGAEAACPAPTGAAA
jgi:tRNA G10  N-methylase Trm11